MMRSGVRLSSAPFSAGPVRSGGSGDPPAVGGASHDAGAWLSRRASWGRGHGPNPGDHHADGLPDEESAGLMTSTTPAAMYQTAWATTTAPKPCTLMGN